MALERARIRENEQAPEVRVQTRMGRWVTLHATRLASAAGSGPVAVLFEPARIEQIAPLLLSAHALTESEIRIARSVLRGMSNKEIAQAKSISPLTVQ